MNYIVRSSPFTQSLQHTPFHSSGWKMDFTRVNIKNRIFVLNRLLTVWCEKKYSSTIKRTKKYSSKGSSNLVCIYLSICWVKIYLVLIFPPYHVRLLRSIYQNHHLFSSWEKWYLCWIADDYCVSIIVVLQINTLCRQY